MGKSRIVHLRKQSQFTPPGGWRSRPPCKVHHSGHAIISGNPKGAKRPGDGRRDWFGTFHGAKRGDWNGGTVHLVFVDARVDSTKSGLQTMPDGVTADYTGVEYGRFEKFGWPFNKPPS